ncbi:MAG: leucine-rich repeat domain-containing protein [Candidatus Korarchaeota archaeon]|nr:leucine-rich repeat domain-containing protein [Candidatus Korarchaeota archaeon]NIU85400.1 hypothetical protein [Candidatus Thorarchaeota archaeon]NIW15497.1 hypothetical protein [Candidatus Thorarchaeota archaeon]NIW53442.1 hypothetical protein [Candidatus Korarchaeota archaeon]
MSSLLKGLKKLESLNLWNTSVSEVSSLRGLRNLRVLILNRTKVSDISPLCDLKKLEKLWVGGLTWGCECLYFLF